MNVSIKQLAPLNKEGKTKRAKWAKSIPSLWKKKTLQSPPYNIFRALKPSKGLLVPLCYPPPLLQCPHGLHAESHIGTAYFGGPC